MTDKKTLFKSSLYAFVFALLVCITIIWPAEYQIDPLGTGKMLGLNKLHQEPATQLMTIEKPKANEHAQTINLPAGKGVEYKLTMNKHQQVNYQWLTDGDPVYVDMHGEPAGDTSGYFESYTITDSNEVKGMFIAPFDGSHGWYWKNNSDKDITIQLIIDGEFAIEGFK